MRDADFYIARGWSLAVVQQQLSLDNQQRISERALLEATGADEIIWSTQEPGAAGISKSTRPRNPCWSKRDRFDRCCMVYIPDQRFSDGRRYLAMLRRLRPPLDGLSLARALGVELREEKHPEFDGTLVTMGVGFEKIGEEIIMRIPAGHTPPKGALAITTERYNKLKHNQWGQAQRDSFREEPREILT